MLDMLEVSDTIAIIDYVGRTTIVVTIEAPTVDNTYRLIPHPSSGYTIWGLRFYNPLTWVPRKGVWCLPIVNEVSQEHVEALSPSLKPGARGSSRFWEVSNCWTYDSWHEPIQAATTSWCNRYRPDVASNTILRRI